MSTTTTLFDPAGPAVGATVTAEGLATHYVEAGSGEPLLLLHGSGPGATAWENWAPAIPALAGHRRVIAYDIPGFGATEPKADGEYGMDFWVDHLFAFMDAVGVESTPVVGNSFGGMVAQAASVRDPRRIERMILMGSAAGEIPMSEAHHLASRYDGSREQLESILRLFPFDPSVLTDEMVDRRHAASVSPGSQKATQKIHPAGERGRAVIQGTPESDLAAVHVPVLILHGRDDKVLPVELAMRVHRAIPGSELHTFGNCGHWVQIERPEGFLTQVLGFLERRS